MNLIKFLKNSLFYGCFLGFCVFALLKLVNFLIEWFDTSISFTLHFGGYFVTIFTEKWRPTGERVGRENKKIRKEDFYEGY